MVDTRGLLCMKVRGYAVDTSFPQPSRATLECIAVDCDSRDGMVDIWSKRPGLVDAQTQHS